jgi:hypothetical protein
MGAEFPPCSLPPLSKVALYTAVSPGEEWLIDWVWIVLYHDWLTLVTLKRSLFFL